MSQAQNQVIYAPSNEASRAVKTSIGIRFYSYPPRLPRVCVSPRRDGGYCCAVAHRPRRSHRAGCLGVLPDTLPPMHTLFLGSEERPLHLRRCIDPIYADSGK